MIDPRLHDALKSLGLDAYAELLAPYATLEIALVHTDDDTALIGTSRIGGAPDLPGLAWPTHQSPLAEVDGWPDYARAEVDVQRGRGAVWDEADHLVMPLPFLMQVDLAATDHRDPRLPRDGLLSFFAAVGTDIADPLFAKRVASTVIYCEADVPLVRRPHPPTADPPPTRGRCLRAEPAIYWDVPYEELPRLEQALSNDAFTSLVADTRRERHALLPTPNNECVGPMPPVGEVALLHLHDDHSVEFPVGDAAWLTFAIREIDLGIRKFERTRASVFIG